MFSCEFYETFKNAVVIQLLRATMSDPSSKAHKKMSRYCNKDISTEAWNYNTNRNNTYENLLLSTQLS